jgi:hypothetical protein
MQQLNSGNFPIQFLSLSFGICSVLLRLFCSFDRVHIAYSGVNHSSDEPCQTRQNDHALSATTSDIGSLLFCATGNMQLSCLQASIDGLSAFQKGTIQYEIKAYEWRMRTNGQTKHVDGSDDHIVEHHHACVHRSNTVSGDNKLM